MASSTAIFPPSWPSQSDTNTLRDVSFSSYLNKEEETYIRKLVIDSSQKIKQPFLVKKDEDEEIDVFSADKYFNDTIDDHRSTKSPNIMDARADRSPLKKDQRVTRGSLGLGILQPGTPSTVRSESSWNSQRVLLKRLKRNTMRSINNNSSSNNKRTQGNRFFPRCSCCNKKSVEINDDDSDDHGYNKGVKYRPGLNKFVGAKPIKTSTNPVQTKEEEEIQEGRKSLEVFGANEMESNGSKSFNSIMEKKLNMLTWDAIPRTEVDLLDIHAPPPISNTSRQCQTDICKDTESDASSDLFEIECLSCTANPVMVPPRVGSESATPTTCYAPSEASIEWSVVTASVAAAADFYTISDSEDQNSTLSTAASRIKMVPNSTPNGKNLGKNEGNKKKVGFLSGCRNHRSVKVVEEVYRTPSKNNKFEAVKLSGIGAKQMREIEGAARTPRWTRSLHGSDHLYI